MTFDKKHRPKTLSDVIFASTDVQQTLEDYANNNRDKHLLLYGPKGTGKSVSAELIMRERLNLIWQAGLAEPFNAKAYAEQHDSFGTLLSQWNWQLSAGAHAGCSIIDEIDQFTLPMQHKLRAFMDQYELGVVIATTNNLHLVDGPLKDRFRPVCVEYPSVQQWVPRVVAVMAAEGIPITPSQALLLLNGFDGSGRSLNDWIEDYVLRLQSVVHKLINPLASGVTSLPALTINCATEGK
ncbi:AAA family ATPase [Amylibacter sp. IMCC11727]|uniref:AAA family ATPase n=1 Tax=Amylibacter sp. IMCC11727 TaxID=3039851 RepID=UPI00244E293C|nr:AAA family ATPase [Amylibacter sp. IMCC11727]WGI21875.1 AAA family ATPase [Amylibacter sp. IMCC11727]